MRSSGLPSESTSASAMIRRLRAALPSFFIWGRRYMSEVYSCGTVPGGSESGIDTPLNAPSTQLEVSMLLKIPT
jgi:hypothetical protein